ncbi:DUF3857 domain-containing protein [Psychroserpens ponticola]|uniref:DUF3857 domain-containing protein n=1 Tax=Psychroserpens ponticola TaxID=2932268 RepID=A0ABY7S1T3_9FLAO|nr:DUF3857 domain-containing protein [Psychroserpens ponticola]WCO03339.1 DUF3857 domain-containing protein [Psychroserpens ponticola]
MPKYFFFFFLVPIFCWSQDFSDEDYIFLKRHEHIKISLKDDTFDIVQNITKQAQFLTSKILLYANETIPYDDNFVQVRNIEAYTYLPETDQKIEVDYIETQQQFDNMVFYSDDKYKSFIFPAVKEGAETYLNYERVIVEPHFLGDFQFASYVPTKSAKISIEFPKTVDLGYTEFNTETIDLEFKKEETDSSFIYTWTANNTAGFEGEDDSEAIAYYLPHIIFYIKTYEYKNEKIGVSGTLDNLYKFYFSLIEKIDESNLDNVYDIAEEITKGIDSKRDKAKAIFNWVQDNIKYVAFSDGYGGFIPAGAGSTFETRYGDCKAMSVLLYEMLNHVDVEAYRTWIGSRNKPYSYFDLPSVYVDDHFITTTIIENDTIFLDATNSYVPFGMPTAFIQNKEALMGINKDNFKIIKVPIQNANKSVTNITSNMRLENGTLKVSEKRSLIGYDKVEFISNYTFRKDSKTDEEYLNTTLALGNNKTKYTNITKANFDNKDIPLVLEYDLDIDSYTRNIGNKIYINLNIDRSLSNSNVEIKDRKYSKKIDYQFEKHFTTNFEIPEGYKASYIPEDIFFEDSNYGFKISYEMHENVITQTKSMYIKTLSVKTDDFENWNHFIKSLLKAYKKSIILEHI